MAAVVTSAGHHGNEHDRCRGGLYENHHAPPSAGNRQRYEKKPRGTAPSGGELMPEVITTRTEWPDSVEIGKVSSGGVLKVYFNSGNLSEAQTRIDNAVAVRQHLLTRLSQGGATV